MTLMPPYLLQVREQCVLLGYTIQRPIVFNLSGADLISSMRKDGNWECSFQRMLRVMSIMWVWSGAWQLRTAPIHSDDTNKHNDSASFSTPTLQAWSRESPRYSSIASLVLVSLRLCCLCTSVASFAEPSELYLIAHSLACSSPRLPPTRSTPLRSLLRKKSAIVTDTP